MASSYPLSDVPLLSAPHEDGGGSARVVRVEPPAPAYTCAMCGSTWQYQQVRNTGRCPACGSGLLRDSDWP